jgi:hypothetical protein
MRWSWLALAFDSLRDHAVLFGGWLQAPQSGFLDDTWELAIIEKYSHCRKVIGTVLEETAASVPARLHHRDRGDVEHTLIYLAGLVEQFERREGAA